MHRESGSLACSWSVQLAAPASLATATHDGRLVCAALLASNRCSCCGSCARTERVVAAATASMNIRDVHGAAMGRWKADGDLPPSLPSSTPVEGHRPHTDVVDSCFVLMDLRSRLLPPALARRRIVQLAATASLATATHDGRRLGDALEVFVD